MPQIAIADHIDPEFLADLAGLGNAWGVVTTETGREFAFMSTQMDAVEAALLVYDTEYLIHRKALKLEQLANIRKVHELNGPNGMVLDDKTVLRLDALVNCYQLNPELGPVKWEVSRGNFQELTKDDVSNIALASMAHVQACFMNVFNKTQEIQAIVLGTEPDALEIAVAALEAIDLNSGWPV